MKYTALVAAAALFSMLGVGQAEAQMAKAELYNAQGKKVGVATLLERSDGVAITLQGSKLPPGPHGFHIHAVGKCEPPGFTSAGGHFNPHGKKHGLKSPAGPHAGDLRNLEVRPDRTVTTIRIAPLVTLGSGPNSLFQPDGTALVIHADPDDSVTDPTGNAGARIACGVISR